MDQILQNPPTSPFSRGSQRLRPAAAVTCRRHRCQAAPAAMAARRAPWLMRLLRSWNDCLNRPGLVFMGAMERKPPRSWKLCNPTTMVKYHHLLYWNYKLGFRLPKVWFFKTYHYGEISPLSWLELELHPPVWGAQELPHHGQVSSGWGHLGTSVAEPEASHGTPSFMQPSCNL